MEFFLLRKYLCGLVLIFSIQRYEMYRVKKGGGGEIGLESRQFIYDENVGPEGGGGDEATKVARARFREIR